MEPWSRSRHSHHFLAFPLSQLDLVGFGEQRQSVRLEVASLVLFLWSSVMGKKLYVGNLSYNTSSSDLDSLFAAHGTVQSAQVIMDRDTGRSKGFGFVEMGSDAEAQVAIQALNGKEIEGRALTVNEAKPREDRGGGRGGSGGRGGYGGGRDRRY